MLRQIHHAANLGAITQSLGNETCGPVESAQHEHPREIVTFPHDTLEHLLCACLFLHKLAHRHANLRFVDEDLQRRVQSYRLRWWCCVSDTLELREISTTIVRNAVGETQNIAGRGSPVGELSAIGADGDFCREDVWDETQDQRVKAQSVEK